MFNDAYHTCYPSTVGDLYSLNTFRICHKESGSQLHVSSYHGELSLALHFAQQLSGGTLISTEVLTWKLCEDLISVPSSFELSQNLSRITHCLVFLNINLPKTINYFSIKIIFIKVVCFNATCDHKSYLSQNKRRWLRPHWTGNQVDYCPIPLFPCCLPRVLYTSLCQLAQSSQPSSTDVGWHKAENSRQIKVWILSKSNLMDD